MKMERVDDPLPMPAMTWAPEEICVARALLARAHAAFVPPPDVVRDEVLRLEIAAFLRRMP
jgi:hypothetical protein